MRASRLALLLPALPLLAVLAGCASRRPVSPRFTYTRSGFSELAATLPPEASALARAEPERFLELLAGALGSAPGVVLGLIFLRYAESKFNLVAKALSESSGRRRVRDDKTAFQAKGAIYLPEQARFTYLQSLPEGEDIGKALNEAMKLIEQENEDLRGVLPKNYTT